MELERGRNRVHNGQTMGKDKEPAGAATVHSGRWPDLKGTCQMVHVGRQDPQH